MVEGESLRAVLRLRVGCNAQFSKMLSGTLLVIAAMQGSRPVSSISALQYRVFWSVVHRSSCSDGMMNVLGPVVLVSLLVLWWSIMSCPKFELKGTCLEFARRNVAFSFNSATL